MKAVICAAEGGVHIHTPGTGIWQVCQCGNTGARWEDPEAGRLIVACRGDRGRVFALGLNNQLLLPAITASGQMWEDYRHWHDHATDAPGYVFDKSRAGCWAVVFRIGSTSDMPCTHNAVRPVPLSPGQRRLDPSQSHNGCTAS